MALQNRPDMYSLGAVELSSQPSVNIYAQHLQRKQAREEALDAYEMNRMNRMNEQGVRDIDRPGLDAKVLDMKTYYQANKDKIRKGGTSEAYNYEKMFRDILAGVSKSKQATAEDETFGKLRLERKKDGRNTPEEWFDIYSKHQQTPIWDENFQALPLSDFMELNAPSYDSSKSLKGYANIEKNRIAGTPTMKSIEGRPFWKQQITPYGFDENAKEAIRVRTKDEFDKDGGFANAVKSDFQNPVQKQNLEKIFFDNYGKVPQDMSDYAVAKRLSELQPVITKTKDVRDDKAYQDDLMRRWREKNAITYGQAVNKIRLNSSLQGKGGTGITLQDVITPDGNTDLTKVLQGVNVNNLVTGKSFKSDKTTYNPRTKEITYHDIVDDKEYTIPATKFRQVINTINTAQDLKTYDQIIEGIDKAYEPAKGSGTKNRPPLGSFIKNK